MSKYDQFIRDFLLKKGQLSAEKIGTFYLGRFAADDKTIQAQLIEFKFNRKEQTSDDLVDFIVKETGKNKTLISSDIASFFEDARQCLNIGKAYSFAGLGMLLPGKAGEYEFKATQGNVAVQEGPANITARTRTEPEDKRQGRRNLVMVSALLIVLLIAAGAGWGVYKYIGQKKAAGVVTTPPANGTDTTAAAAAPKATDSAVYRFVFESRIGKNRAHNRYDSLKSWGEHVFIDSTGTDSTAVYNLYMKIKLTAKDTAYVKDSIQKYLGHPVTIAGN